MKTRVGPSMLAVVEYVRANPGCTQNQANKALNAKGDNWQVINRTVKAGLITRHPVLTEDGYPKAYALYVSEG